MSKILRRPMFRGGAVDSRGTGITSGLGYEAGGRVGYNQGNLVAPLYTAGNSNFKTGKDVSDLASQKFSAGLPFSYELPIPLNIQKPKNETVIVGDESEIETPTGDIFSKMTDDFDVNESNIFEGYENFEDLPKTIQNVTSKTDFNRNKKEQADIKESIQSDINAKGYLPTPGPEKGVIETDDKGGVKLTGGTTGNTEQKTELSARDLVRENADLFKEFLNEGNEKKLKDARIGDASDYLLKFFEGSQREGATVGSSAADVAAFATAKDSKTERAKAAIDKTNDTATVLAINDYIAGKRSKEQIQAMMAKSDVGFAQAIALADYKKGKENFFDNYKENRKTMGASEAAIFTVQETFSKAPTVLTDKDIKQENFGLLNEENIGEYFVYPDGKVTKIDKIGNELTEVPIYTRG